MKISRSFQFLSVIGLVVGGCATPPQSKAQLEDRLMNAQLLNDASTHESRLRQIAIDSANFNVESVCAKAISDMTESTLRDETAEEASHIFDDRGDRPSAEALVNLINDGARRDKMREEFSTTPFKTPVDANGNPIPAPTTRP